MIFFKRVFLICLFAFPFLTDTFSCKIILTFVYLRYTIHVYSNLHGKPLLVQI